MIAALHNSRIDATKPNRFRQGKEATAFGWEAIQGLLKREIQRIQSGQLARVPGLKESFVHRDSWTRLNVKPAKIMQVGPVLLVALSLPLSHRRLTHTCTHTHSHSHMYTHSLSLTHTYTLTHTCTHTRLYSKSMC